MERDLPEGGQERLILAEALLAKVFGDEPVKVVDHFKGKHIKGKRYSPLLHVHASRQTGSFRGVKAMRYHRRRFWNGAYRPAFGAEDMAAALEHDLPMLMTVAEDGTFKSDIRPWAGKFVKDADPYIIQDLQARGLMFRSGTVTHTYPFCWRCATPLLYYARPTWYVRTRPV